MCARAAGTEALVNSTVCASRPLSWRGRTLRKVSDGVFWTYQLPAEAGQKRPPSLASCSAMGGGSRPGLCTADLPYDNLVLTIHFRDNQVGSLQALYRSEEQPSELQSLMRISYAVFCLKKKKNDE